MNRTDEWISRFTEELERRGVSDQRIRDEVETVRDHISDAGSDADSAFGDAVAYAATIARPADEDTPPQSIVLTLFGSIAAFLVFVIAGVRWIEGDSASATWAVLGGLALVGALAALSIVLTRRAVAGALRDRLSTESDARWRLSSSLLLLVPWIFIGFAGVVLTLAALL